MPDFFDDFKELFPSDADAVYPPIGNQRFYPNQQRSRLTSGDPDHDDEAAAPSLPTEVTDQANDGWVPRSSPALGKCPYCPQEPFSSLEEAVRHYSEIHPEEQWNDQPLAGSPPEYLFVGVNARYGVGAENEQLAGGVNRTERHELDTEGGERSPTEGHELDTEGDERSPTEGHGPNTGGGGAARGGADRDTDLIGVGEGATEGARVRAYPIYIVFDEAQELAHNGCNGNTGNHNGHSHGDAGGPGVG